MQLIGVHPIDQDLPCGGKPPAPCNNCIRRQHDCTYDEAQRGGGGGGRSGRSKKTPAGPGGVGTPPTNFLSIPSGGGDSPASATRKSKRMISEAVPAVSSKKRQRVASKRGQQAAADASSEHEGDADGDVDMGAEELAA